MWPEDGSSEARDPDLFCNGLPKRLLQPLCASSFGPVEQGRSFPPRAEPTLGGLGAGERRRATPRLRVSPPGRRDALGRARVSAGPGVGASEVGGLVGKSVLGSAHFSTVRLATAFPSPPKLNHTELAGEAVKKRGLTHVAGGNLKIV